MGQVVGQLWELTSRYNTLNKLQWVRATTQLLHTYQQQMVNLTKVPRSTATRRTSHTDVLDYVWYVGRLRQPDPGGPLDLPQRSNVLPFGHINHRVGQPFLH